MKLYKRMAVLAVIFTSILSANFGYSQNVEEVQPIEIPPGFMPKTPPAPREFVASGHLQDIFFDRGSAKIRKDMTAILDKNAKWLKINENYLIVVEGHADETGTNEYNINLGEKRAMAVRSYLIAAGVDEVRITVISYGEERPVAFEHNEEAWKRNRRVSFLIKVWR